MDPHLSRSVVVSTKLDTRLPQFARGHDVELFLRPPGRLLEPGMLGGCPFFTCAAACRLCTQSGGGGMPRLTALTMKPAQCHA